MKLPGHILVSPSLLLLHPIIGNYGHLILASFASVFIDIDHIQLLIGEKVFSFSKIKELYRNIYKNYSDNPSSAYKKVFYLFHTVEFNILLLVLSLWWPPLMFVVLGFAFHIVCDIIHHKLNGMPILRWLFLYKFLLPT
jgi:pilus assembly protein TadC